MTPEEAADTVREHFRSQWLVQQTGWDHAAQTAWGNKSFEPPSTGPWVEFNFDFSTSTRAEIGNKLWRHTSVVALSIYVPKFTGRDVFDGLVTSALDVFQESQPDEVRVLDTAVGVAGIDERGRYRADLVIDVQYDQRY